MQDAIVANLIDELSVKLSEPERQVLRKREMRNPDAYRAYLLGRYQYSALRRDSLLKSIESFKTPSRSIRIRARVDGAFVFTSRCDSRSRSTLRFGSMKLSTQFQLKKSQYELDFVDIDPSRDTPLFLDPYFLSIQEDPWSYAATATIRNFFEHFINLVRAGNLREARELFSRLGEPNETCLGLSRGRPEGRGIGKTNADDMFKSLLKSQAVQTGIVEHLEDARIFVDGIDKDKVSDMTTNILRAHLVDYTQDQCILWGLPLQKAPSGNYWSATNRRWEVTYADRLVVNGRPLLLVPKAVVSFDDKYTAGQYHEHFVLEYLKNEHVSLNSALVQRRIGTGEPFVTKKDLKEKEAPLSKTYLLEFTEKHPEIFRDFRERVSTKMKRLVNEGITSESLSEVTDYLIEKLRSLPAGNEHATEYHRLVAGILELIFYPNLFAPRLEREIHEGRKRIDLVFDNGAKDGIFHRLHAVFKIPCPFIMVECKNYSRDIANPELDQMGGRFSPNRGKVGMIVFRTVDDLGTLMSRCADTYRDDRGVILPVTDEDLITILQGITVGVTRPEESILEERLRSLAIT